MAERRKKKGRRKEGKRYPVKKTSEFFLVERRAPRNTIHGAHHEPQYILNSGFEFFLELRSLILKASPAEKDDLIRKLLKVGRVRLAVISGIFLNQPENITAESAADLFVVADDLNKRKLHRFLRTLEADVGTEIRFAAMEKDEFEYRYGMFDRFVRVLLEGPHEKIINRLGI